VKRLLETDHGGPVVERAKELLVALEPLAESELGQRRIHQEIERLPTGRRGRRVAPLLLVAVVLSLVGVAGAMSGGVVPWWRLKPAADQQWLPAPAAPRAPAAARSRGLPDEGEAATDEATTDEANRGDEPTDPVQVDSASESGRVAHRGRSPSKAAPTPPHSAPTPAASLSGSDVARVHEAARALRGDGDPERAAKLLEEVPLDSSGPLAEEALALRIEAALDRGDPSAARHARDYLARYPSGRYRALADRALAVRSTK